MKRRQLVVVGAASVGLPVFGMPEGGWSAGASSRPQRQRQADIGQAVTAEYFGTHFHRLVPGTVLGREPTRWPQSGIGSVRLWDSSTRWADLAPRRGRWDFARLDALVDLAEQHQASVLYTLGSTPRWASSRPDEIGPYGPGSAAEPKAMSDWDDYVRRVLARYKGRIGAYEVWNEPYFSDFAADRRSSGFFTGTIERMVEMTRLARVALDAIDPQALLASPGFVNGAHRIHGFLAGGGAPLIDVMAYHFYCPDSSQFLREVAEVREVLARHGLARLPFWNTECGIEDSARSAESADTGRFGGDRGAAATLAQFLILGAASQLGRFYYHAWDNDLTGMVDRFGAINARAPVFAQVRQWLVGSRFDALRTSDDGVRQIEAEHGDERRIFLWSEKSQTVPIPTRLGWHVAAVMALPDMAVAGRQSDAARQEIVLTTAPVCVRLVRGAAS